MDQQPSYAISLIGLHEVLVCPQECGLPRKLLTAGKSPLREVQMCAVVQSVALVTQCMPRDLQREGVNGSTQTAEPVGAKGHLIGSNQRRYGGRRAQLRSGAVESLPNENCLGFALENNLAAVYRIDKNGENGKVKLIPLLHDFSCTHLSPAVDSEFHKGGDVSSANLSLHQGQASCTEEDGLVVPHLRQ
ncbi:E3 ubiquitin-protein ligase SH3RF2 [Manis javanica]|nr:E3 ubiquitin-protein ligase SH3RF2 [Manis javanica]